MQQVSDHLRKAAAPTGKKFTTSGHHIHLATRGHSSFTLGTKRCSRCRPVFVAQPGKGHISVVHSTGSSEPEKASADTIGAVRVASTENLAKSNQAAASGLADPSTAREASEKKDMPGTDWSAWQGIRIGKEFSHWRSGCHP